MKFYQIEVPEICQKRIKWDDFIKENELVNVVRSS